jgi:aerobic carbon-monoxide dehydrogenase medium subunit
VIPAAFDYDVAESVDHAIELLSDGGSETKLLAGGQSLIPALKLRIVRPTKLVDLGRLDDLAYVRDGGTHVAIGALTRHAAVAADPLLAEHCTIVSHTAGQIGDPSVRSRGTLGGTMAHGDPASDMPAVMLALGADVVARGTDGERVIPATEFFTGVFESACAPDEVVVEVRVPKLAASTGWSYVKAQRRAQDWATVGVAALVHRDNGSVAGPCEGRRGRDRGRGNGRRRGGARRRRGRAACRPRGLVRVPRPSRAGDRAASARRGGRALEPSVRAERVGDPAVRPTPRESGR